MFVYKNYLTGNSNRILTESRQNIKRDFYLDVYTVLIRIKFTRWTICAFRVLNPHQWSLAKMSYFQKMKKRCPKRAKTSWSQKGWCNKPTKLQFQTISTRKIFMLSNATNQPKSTVELGYMCPRGLTGQCTNHFGKDWTINRAKITRKSLYF